MTIRAKAPILSLLLAFVLAAPSTAAEAEEANLDVLISTLQVNKKGLVAVNLGLDDDQGKAFWPIYDRYQEELTKLRKRLLALIDDYAANYLTMTDEQAAQLIDSYLAIERDRMSLLQEYLKPFSEALPGRTLARFYQIENKIDAILRYELAQQIPVIAQ